ncbi:hypothetical protein CBS101457_002354 [Exobasidium rhododendri]|nr:hypothetical protein CBS101457_002354 [Exobasidium rhododendri]
MPSLDQQVAEVQLLRASTAADEFCWRGSEKDEQVWETIVLSGIGDDQLRPSLSFALRLAKDETAESGPGLWLNIDYSHDPLEEVKMTLQGPTVGRHDMERVKRVIEARRKETTSDDFENVAFDTFTAIQAYLAEEPIELTSPAHLPEKKEMAESVVLNRQVIMSRVIFWSHHLKAPSKKRDMNAWCSELSLWGLVKSGYPGYLAFEGRKEDVDEIVRRIKALQWHAIQVKTDEPYTYQATLNGVSNGAIEQEAIRHCLLAKGHSSEVPADKVDLVKVRTSMDEVESGKELIDRVTVKRY